MNGSEGMNGSGEREQDPQTRQMNGSDEQVQERVCAMWMILWTSMKKTRSVRAACRLTAGGVNVKLILTISETIKTKSNM